MGFAKPARNENANSKQYFKPRDHLERLAAFRVTRAERVKNRFDELKDTVFADVTIIDGPDSGIVYPNADLAFEVLYQQLHESVGRDVVLGRISKGNKAFFLDDPTEADEDLAQAHFAGADNDEPPF